MSSIEERITKHDETIVKLTNLKSEYQRRIETIELKLNFHRNASANLKNKQKVN